MTRDPVFYEFIHELHELTRIKIGYKDKRPTQKQAPDPKQVPQDAKVCHPGQATLDRDPVFYEFIHELHELTRIKIGYKDKRPTQKQAPDPKQVPQDAKVCHPGQAMLDPGSSLLKTSTNYTN